ncbi:MAG TPA: thermonuclease family protein [Clostridiaceae bacterium]|nr:thermonuclease family protein [Clostridiaceae bacterium]
MRNKLSILLIAIFLLASCDNASFHRKHGNNPSVQDKQITNKKAKKETFQFKKGEEYSVKVVGISDGDTFTGLTDDNQQIKCRIYGIDAPEKRQAFGNVSKQTLSDLIFGKQVQIKIQNKDRWQRAVVWVYSSDKKDICAEMLKAGMAWHYKKYDNSDEYAELENKARQNRIGLWHDNSPIPPWNFRKQNKSMDVNDR